ncbi:kunitz trypsin inhibitor 5-like [Rutidosis leptorrhynchoides]|uniref:kunitz trypsin inhibitor 5-like n=1 Tax=Rutidosis leptorrhynchoides TaxID=125765 RepID=UPI003A9A1479
MKTITLLSLSFILCVFSVDSASFDSVLDITGKNLRAGVDYYVMPAAKRGGSGGGITAGRTGQNKTCAQGVAQLQTNKYGLPLTFTPVDPKKHVIRLSTDVNIKFSGHNNCNESNIWKINYNEGVKQYFLILGGVEGNPGRETLDNWFKIEKTEDGYKFVFCPTVCNFCKVLCRDVGIFLDDTGMRRLALTLGDPFSLVFIAAK